MIWIGFLLAIPWVYGQENADVRLRSESKEVLLDFVVRDRHRKLIRDLRANEIHILEDGVPQILKSLIFRDGTEPRKGSDDPLREVSLVSVVFESMSPESRGESLRHARELLEKPLYGNTFFGVFSLQHQLRVIQPYTSDRAVLLRSLDRVGKGDLPQFAKENAESVKRWNSLQSATNPGQFRPMEPGSAEERGAAVGQGSVATAIEKRMLRLTFQMIYEQEGSRSIDGLRRLIRQQAGLIGRKTVLLVSEGLMTPPEQPDLLRSVISEANRGNITFYTLDARGLTTTSSLELANQSAGALYSTSGGVAANDSAETRHTDLQENARELAEGTGGFAMANSNDLRASLSRMREEVASHYEATYTPVSSKFDGHFRSIAVTLDRPEMKVQSRSGYYDLPLLNGEGLLPFEMAALDAVHARPTPRAFELSVAALRFDESLGGSEYRVVFAIPNKALRAVDASSKFRLHAAVLGLITDLRGEVVAKVSRDLPFEAPIEKRSAFQKGTLIVSLPVYLLPGSYRLWAAALDRETGAASVQETLLSVPGQSAARDAIDVSDVVWVKDVAVSGANRDWSNPLETSEGVVTPNLRPVFASSDTPAFLAWVYLKRSSTSQPSAQITLSRSGVTLATVPVEIAMEAGKGVVMGRLPLKGFGPGEYVMSLEATQDGSVARSQVGMRVGVGKLILKQGPVLKP